MAGITIAQALDLGLATLAAFDTEDVQMTLKHQTYEVMHRWFAADKKVLGGGKKVTWDINLKDTGNAKHTRIFDTDTPNIANVVKEGEANWTHFQNSFSYNVKELAINRDNKTRIFDLLKNRRLNCIRESADALEEAAWKTPTDSTDDLNPFGIFGWLSQGTNGSTGAFDAYVANYWSDASSTFNAGNVACTSALNTNWASYYIDHDGNLDDSLMKSLRRAFRKTKFQSPVIGKEAVDPQSDFYNFRFYTNSAVLDEIEELATKSDDAIGYDLGKYAGAVVFKGIPFIYVDSLDTAKQYVYGSNPIVGVNHKHFYPIVLSDENFRWNPPMPHGPGQHNTLTVYLDLSYAYVCKNRRVAGFLISNYQGT